MIASSEKSWPPPELPPATTVPISSLVSTKTPRLGGVNKSHIRTLAEIHTGLPPILVHKSTGHVIDGIHRLRAALLRGEDMIEARFIDVSEEEAFLIAVSVNVTHGLPLSLADRKAAARRIVEVHPEWSDRTIAATAGLSPKTVRAIRKSSGEENPHLNSRIGRDGRIYPVNGADGRRRVRQAVEAHPEASTRQIAAIAGVSVGTVHKMRERLQQEQVQTPPIQSSSLKDNAGPQLPNRSVALSGAVVGRATALDRRAIEQRLKRDPALKHSESGRSLIKWLNACSIASEECRKVVDIVPSRWSTVVVDLARSYAQEWQQLAGELDRRGKQDAG